MRKPRRPSRILALPAAQLEKLIRWLTTDGLTYDQAIVRCHDEFGLKTSNSALSEFYSAHFAALGIAQKQPRPPLLEIIIAFTAPDKISLKIIPGAGITVEGKTK